jgi:hypothetical protein
VPRLLPLLALVACAGPPPEAPAGAFPLRWYRTDAAWTWEAARAGLWWSLSHLGAAPADGSGLVLLDEDDTGARFALEPEVFPAEARPALDLVAEELLASDEHALYGSVDVGRFLSRALDPWPYYAATGACPTREAWEVAHLAGEIRTFPVTRSLLTEAERRVAWPASMSTIAEIVYQAEGGEGSHADGTFVVRDAEVVGFLPNGQQRYAVYADGELSPAADPAHSGAGAPTKCMWCHEEGLQPVSPENPDLDGYATRAQFEADRAAAEALLLDHRSADPVVPYADWLVAHREGERLVDAFTQVPLTRLADEWSVPVREIEGWVAERGLATTRVFEEDHLGEALDRDAADALLAEVLPELAARRGHPFEGWTGSYEPIPVQTDLRAYDPAKSPDPEPFRALLDCR